MSVFTLIRDFCQVQALSIPTNVIGSTDTTVLQLYGILNEILSEVVTESKFNVITQEAVFTFTAAEDQGRIQLIAPNGYQWIYNATMFDRTLRRPLYGPISEEDWQKLKALPNPGPFYKYRLRGDHLLINPVPTAPFSTIAFEYASSWAVYNSAGVLKAAITEDTDTFVFPENILARGLKYRWKQIKGLPYQADEVKYYDLLNNYIVRNKTAPRIDLAHPVPMDVKPGVFIPSGNWNV